MSGYALTLAFELPVPPTPKLVAIAIADMADGGGVTGATDLQLAQCIGLPVEQVTRAIAYLTRKGALVVYEEDGAREMQLQPLRALEPLP